MVCDLPDISILENTICKPCKVSKQNRVHFSKKQGSESKPLELIHTDLCGPTRKKSPCGEEYFILFIVDFSRMCWIGLLKHKDEAFEKFKTIVLDEAQYLLRFCKWGSKLSGFDCGENSIVKRD